MSRRPLGVVVGAHYSWRSCCCVCWDARRWFSTDFRAKEPTIPSAVEAVGAGRRADAAYHVTQTLSRAVIRRAFLRELQKLADVRSCVEAAGGLPPQVTGGNDPLQDPSAPPQVLLSRAHQLSSFRDALPPLPIALEGASSAGWRDHCVGQGRCHAPGPLPPTVPMNDRLRALLQAYDIISQDDRRFKYSTGFSATNDMLLGIRQDLPALVNHDTIHHDEASFMFPSTTGVGGGDDRAHRPLADFSKIYFDVTGLPTYENYTTFVPLEPLPLTHGAASALPAATGNHHAVAAAAALPQLAKERIMAAAAANTLQRAVASSSETGTAYAQADLHRRLRPKRGADVTFALKIPFEEGFLGGEQVIAYDRQFSCRSCEGHGFALAAARNGRRCVQCGGAGTLLLPSASYVIRKPCLHCRGLGSVPPPPCKVCQGQGVIPRPASFTLQLEPGTQSGCKLRFKGRGHAGKRQGDQGDLIVHITVRPHAIFERPLLGYDLHCLAPIPLSVGILGGQAHVPTLTRDGAARRLGALRGAKSHRRVPSVVVDFSRAAGKVLQSTPPPPQGDDRRSATTPTAAAPQATAASASSALSSSSSLDDCAPGDLPFRSTLLRGESLSRQSHSHNTGVHGPRRQASMHMDGTQTHVLVEDSHSHLAAPLGVSFDHIVTVAPLSMTGTIIRVPEQGMLRPDGASRGDLVIHLVCRIPDGTVLTPLQRRSVREFDRYCAAPPPPMTSDARERDADDDNGSGLSDHGRIANQRSSSSSASFGLRHEQSSGWMSFEEAKSVFAPSMWGAPPPPSHGETDDRRGGTAEGSSPRRADRSATSWFVSFPRVRSSSTTGGGVIGGSTTRTTIYDG